MSLSKRANKQTIDVPRDGPTERQTEQAIEHNISNDDMRKQNKTKRNKIKQGPQAEALRTDRPTDRRTDTRSYRVASSGLKRINK